MKLPKPVRRNEDNKALFEHKQDIIDWLNYMLQYQDLHSAECMAVNHNEVKKGQIHIKVFVDEVIRKRYRDMIDWLKSDEVA